MLSKMVMDCVVCEMQMRCTMHLRYLVVPMSMGMLTVCFFLGSITVGGGQRLSRVPAAAGAFSPTWRPGAAFSPERFVAIVPIKS